jgi:hypothetical protein
MKIVLQNRTSLGPLYIMTFAFFLISCSNNEGVSGGVSKALGLVGGSADGANPSSVYTNGAGYEPREFQQMVARAAEAGLSQPGLQAAATRGSGGYSYGQWSEFDRRMRSGQDLNEAHFDSILNNPQIPEAVKVQIRMEREKERSSFRNNHIQMAQKFHGVQNETTPTPSRGIQEKMSSVANQGKLTVGSVEIPINP